MPFRFANDVDTTFVAIELHARPEEKACVGVGEGRHTGGECGSAGCGAAATLTGIVRRRATSLPPANGASATWTDVEPALRR